MNHGFTFTSNHNRRLWWFTWNADIVCLHTRNMLSCYGCSTGTQTSLSVHQKHVVILWLFTWNAEILFRWKFRHDCSLKRKQVSSIGMSIGMQTCLLNWNEDKFLQLERRQFCTVRRKKDKIHTCMSSACVASCMSSVAPLPAAMSSSHGRVSPLQRAR